MYFTSKNHLFPQLLNEWLVRNLKFKGHPPLFMNPWKLGHNKKRSRRYRCGGVRWVGSSPPPTLRRYHQWPHLTSASVGLRQGVVGPTAWFFGNGPSERGEHTESTKTHIHSIYITISANPYRTITSGTLTTTFFVTSNHPDTRKASISPRVWGPYHCQDKCPCAWSPKRDARTMWLNFGYVTNFRTPWKWKFGKFWFMSNESVFRFHVSLVGGWTNPFETY